MGLGILVIMNGLFIIALCIWGIYFTLKKQKEEREAPTNYESIYNIWLKHSKGLPLASGAEVHIYYCNDKFVFVSDSQRYTLNINSVQSINTTRLADSGSGTLSNAAAGKYISNSTAGGFLAAGIADMDNWYFTISYITNDNKLNNLYFKAGAEISYCDKIKDHFYKNHAPKTITNDIKL